VPNAVPPEETAASRPPPPDVDARKRLTSKIAVGRLFAAARKVSNCWPKAAVTSAGSARQLSGDKLPLAATEHLGRI